MNDVDDEVKGDDGIGDEPQQQRSTDDMVSATDPLVVAVSAAMQSIEQIGPLKYLKDDENEVKEETATSTNAPEKTVSTLNLLGNPLVSHGPYTFYEALEYREHEVTKKKRLNWKKRQSKVTVGNDTVATESCDSSSSCRCDVDETKNDLCSCKVSLSSCPEWFVMRMNHFYAVRPWYSKRNSSAGDRQQLQQQQRRRRRKNSPTSKAMATERRQHHHQQSVFIGELELLWRDDSMVMAKRSSNRVTSAASNGITGSDGIDITTSSSNSLQGCAVASSDDDDNGGGVENDDDLSLPTRRMLPRRTRQPSAKKIAAAESYAAATAASTQQSNRRNQIPSTLSTDPVSTTSSVPLLPNSHYTYGNLLCSVRLYVMPDQTASGRLSGVHGEDEVLEINTWGASSGVERDIFINGCGTLGSIYNEGNGGVDDYGYGSGSHSSGSLPSGCSGLVLRVEDFIEWVRGGMMDDDDYENENTDSDDESMKSECDDRSSIMKTKHLKQDDGQQLQLITTDIKCELNEKSQKEKINILHVDQKDKLKLESTSLTNDDISENVNKLKKEENSLLVINTNLNKVKQEQEATVGDSSNVIEEKFNKKKYKSAIDEAVEAEHIPLAAANILERHSIQNRSCRHQHHPDCKSLINGNDANIMKHEQLKTSGIKGDDKCDDVQKNCNKIIQSCGISNGNNQRLVVMSYSRYCRYRAQLQRKQEEQLIYGDSSLVSGGNKNKATHREVDTMSTIRVLFCRDTYDYPAELLLQPFNSQQCHKKSTTVLANHMAPKLKGWPAYPASWMSFRWNRVRRRLRHLEHGSGSNDDQRRRRRRRKLKKKTRQQQNGAGRTMVGISYSSSTEDGESGDSDSDDGSSATNDGATTNTTTTVSTSDSDGPPPPSPVVVKTSKHSVATTKVNGGVQPLSKKSLAVITARNMITINGTTVTATTVNKRPAGAVVQPGQQQTTKRRRITYTAVGSQSQQQQRIVYQQQQHSKSKQSEQFNQFSQAQRQHMLVIQQQQQQQRFQSLNRRLPIPIATLQQSPGTKIIHHHLPPSVSIMPVVVSSTITGANQQQQRFNNKFPNRQKQQAVVSVTQRRNNSSRQQTSLHPVIIEYNNGHNQESGSDNNGRYTKSTVAAAMAACRRVGRQNVEEEQIQQREDEERQRRWLVDALRLGGLEVTAVPLSSRSSGSNTREIISFEASQQEHQFQQWQQDDNDHHNGDIIQDDQRQDGDNDSETDSVVMTVTPDVICLLNKSREQQEEQQTSSSASMASLPLDQQRRKSVNSNNNVSDIQQQHPVVNSEAAAAALHDKINRAIDSLKQQQQKPKSSVPISKSNTNILVMDRSNFYQSNSNNNYRHQQQQKRRKSSDIGFRHQQTLPALLDLSVKSMSNNDSTSRQHRLPSSTSNTISPQKSVSPFNSITAPTSSANLEITIVPVTATTTTNVTRFQLQQQQQKSSFTSTVHNNLISASEAQSGVPASPLTVRRQLQRQSAASTTTSSSIIQLLSNRGNEIQQHNGSGTSVSATISSSQQHILMLAASAAAAAQTKQQQINKTKTQNNKKD